METDVVSSGGEGGGGDGTGEGGYGSCKFQGQVLLGKSEAEAVRFQLAGLRDGAVTECCFAAADVGGVVALDALFGSLVGSCRLGTSRQGHRILQMSYYGRRRLDTASVAAGARGGADSEPEPAALSLGASGAQGVTPTSAGPPATDWPLSRAEKRDRLFWLFEAELRARSASTACACSQTDEAASDLASSTASTCSQTDVAAADVVFVGQGFCRAPTEQQIRDLVEEVAQAAVAKALALSLSGNAGDPSAVLALADAQPGTDGAFGYSDCRGADIQVHVPSHCMSLCLPTSSADTPRQGAEGAGWTADLGDEAGVAGELNAENESIGQRNVPSAMDGGKHLVPSGAEGAGWTADLGAAHALAAIVLDADRDEFKGCDDMKSEGANVPSGAEGAGWTADLGAVDALAAIVLDADRDVFKGCDDMKSEGANVIDAMDSGNHPVPSGAEGAGWTADLGAAHAMADIALDADRDEFKACDDMKSEGASLIGFGDSEKFQAAQDSGNELNAMGGGKHFVSSGAEGAGWTADLGAAHALAAIALDADRGKFKGGDDIMSEGANVFGFGDGEGHGKGDEPRFDQELDEPAAEPASADFVDADASSRADRQAFDDDEFVGSELATAASLGAIDGASKTACVEAPTEVARDCMQTEATVSRSEGKPRAAAKPSRHQRKRLQRAQRRARADGSQLDVADASPLENADLRPLDEPLEEADAGPPTCSAASRLRGPRDAGDAGPVYSEAAWDFALDMEDITARPAAAWAASNQLVVDKCAQLNLTTAERNAFLSLAVSCQLADIARGGGSTPDFVPGCFALLQQAFFAAQRRCGVEFTTSAFLEGAFGLIDVREPSVLALAEAAISACDAASPLGSSVAPPVSRAAAIVVIANAAFDWEWDPG